MNEPSNKLTQADSFLTLHYRITTAEGEELVSTFGLSPATLQMGSGQLSEGLERCLLALGEGERRVFDLPPDEAFGASNPALVERILLSALPSGMVLQENSLVEFTTPEGRSFSGFLRELTATHGLFDFNHPLSGKSIRFEAEILSIL